MIYELKGKHYIKLSGYLIEVTPYLKDGELDFKTTNNKVEITPDLIYKSVSIDTIKKELNSNSSKTDEETEEFKPKKLNERTHNKYKIGYKD